MKLMRESHLRAVNTASALFAVAVLLTGCTAPILMRHPVTGKTYDCGNHNNFGLGSLTARTLDQGCISEYKDMGYQRVP